MVIDDLIVGAVGGSISVPPEEIERMMTDKIGDLYTQQGDLDINYTMEELNAGQSWWLIEVLGFEHPEQAAASSQAELSAANVFPSSQVVQVAPPSTEVVTEMSPLE